MTTRRPSLLLAVTCTLVAAALAGCGSDSDGSDDTSGDGAPPAGAVQCEEGTVGDAGDPAEADVRITRYDAQLTIADTGALHATETIAAEFDDGEHHGIVRNLPGKDYAVSAATGTVDGAPSGVFNADVPGGGHLTLGDADVTLAAGEHVFGVDYTADSALEPSTGVAQDQQFDAAVIDPAWSLDIADATVTITLPADSGDVSCIVGPGATATITGVGTPTLVMTADEVPAGSGVRVLVGVDVPPHA